MESDLTNNNKIRCTCKRESWPSTLFISMCPSTSWVSLYLNSDADNGSTPLVEPVSSDIYTRVDPDIYPMHHNNNNNR